MKNALNSVKISTPSTNAFDLSHDVKMSCNMGQLIPCLAMEVIPGDRIRLGCENIVRMAAILAPIMHLINVRVEYYFSPNRLVWPNWETWITNGGDQPDLVDPLPAHPYITYSLSGDPSHVGYNRLLDYMGLPDPSQCPIPSGNENISALPFAHYQKIYDEYYRDQNLIDSVFTELSDGNNTGGGGDNLPLVQMRYRAWEADYFTKALPFAQKGNPVEMPFNFGDVPAKVNENLNPGTDLTGVPANVLVTAEFPVGDDVQSNELFAQTSLLQGSSTINDLRLAYRLQEWLEKNARGGTRYSELIRSHFNVRPEDARLQRPEYIVGVKDVIQISEVLNTTGTDDAPQGTMAGHGVSYNQGNYGKYFATEHGYVIGILSIMPKTAYQQGIPKHFLKFTDPTQLAWPTFGNLGEQPIQNREIMAFRGSTGDGTFGYTPRYMEYKNLPSRVCGDFRTTLDFWHMGRIFDTDNPPFLNEQFVSADPTNRIFAVEEDVDHLYCQLMHHIHVVRALPFYGTPTF